MFHQPADQGGKDPAATYKTALGVRMFIGYAIVYAGFIGINLISPLSMELEVFMGLNLAVTYGFGLIVSALILAVIYNQLCNNKEAELATSSEEKAE
ncbi:MAG: hypothetical protein CVV42_00350 [Candidatus Riflebacteria bacterium HGW-Riflebacteria-2]|nr:MAG: hypothetical protein CVV42_00350 [Candidatus Riflebacteria bacterium HGW-Riflebacteria-2]